MPSVSPKQKRTMQAAAHSPQFARKVGIPQSVARDFARHDGTYAQGGAAMMLPSQFGTIVQPRGALRMDVGGEVGIREPFVRGQGPRPAWWPEDRPWAPGDIGYGGGQIKPMLPTQPGMIGALGAFDMAQPYPAPGGLDPTLGRGNLVAPGLLAAAQPLQPWEGGGGGGGGMAQGGAVRRRFEEGGDVDGGDAGSRGERDNTEGGDLSGNDRGPPDPDQGQSSPGWGGRSDLLGPGYGEPTDLTKERGFFDKITDFLDRDLAQAMLGALPGGTLAGLIGRGLADYADRNQLSRDNATPGVGGTAGPFGGSGGALAGSAVGPGRDSGGSGAGGIDYTNDRFAADRAAPAVPAAPGALAASPLALRLPALQQPTFDPRTYGFGPAAAWLR